MANSIETNCGKLTPRIFETCKLPNGPTLTNGQIPKFHSIMCKWALGIPMKFMWVIVIDAHNAEFLGNKVKNILPNYEVPGWNISDSYDATWNNDTQNTIGCIFAQGVSIPGETVNIDYAGVAEGSNRGFINSPIVNGRSNFEPLEIGFLETNKSFVDGVLRPWLILVAHEGLIAQDRNKSIKADIHVYQLARNGACRNNIIRKAFTYYNCAPIHVAPEAIDYGPSSDYPKIQARFVYSSYSVTDFSDSGSGSFSPAAIEDTPQATIGQVNSQGFGNSVRYIS